MREPIRVAQVLNRMDSGGIESVVMNYYRHIDREKVQFDFYFSQDSVFPQKRELERLGAGIYPMPSYSRPLAYHKALCKAFREKRYRIVHAHLSTMSVFALFAAWQAGVPVRICHNHTTAYKGEGAKTLLKYILRPWNKLFATDYFACGEAAGRWMYGEPLLNSGKVVIMPNAIDTGKFTFDPEARKQLRDELKIPQDNFVIGHVGRFMYQKNHGFLLDVFAEALKREPEARLLLIGEGELLKSTQEKSRDLKIWDRVIFTGARTDVNKLYSVMDVFCLPSFYEGMPVVAWEAQANGLPCVFSDRTTQEAVCNPNCQLLNLSLEQEKWARALLCVGNRVSGTPPNIGKAAVRLLDFYGRVTAADK